MFYLQEGGQRYGERKPGETKEKPTTVRRCVAYTV